VSADLVELSRAPVLLVCSGPKSIVDPVATSERLEELGVAVVGYRCARLPFFLALEAPVDLEHRVDRRRAANLVAAMRELGQGGDVALQPDPRDVRDASGRSPRPRLREARAERSARRPHAAPLPPRRGDGGEPEANLAARGERRARRRGL
jgi:pseudouridine-5'-phosphate glycosidase